VGGEYTTSSEIGRKRYKEKNERNKETGGKEREAWDIDECPPEISDRQRVPAVETTAPKSCRAYQAVIRQTWRCKRILHHLPWRYCGHLRLQRKVMFL
jgi:hypothetical protein